MTYPIITIGMLTKNRAWCIRKVLGAIEKLEYLKKKIKLVFVDDHSTDGTFETLAEWRAKINNWYYDIILIQERTNIPQARNICIKHMEGKYLLFWDSDVIPPKDLLKQMVDIMESNPDIGIIGTDYLYKHTNMYMRMLGKPVTNRFTHAVYMGFTLIRREVFEKVQGFNELLSVGEDTEFCIRVAEKTDYKIMWAPRPVIHLRPQEAKLFKQSFNKWLSYNFHIRGKEYAESFNKLPLFLRFRIFYYTFLPLILIFSLFIAYYTNLVWALLAFITYLLPGLFLAVRNLGIRKGILSFLILNIPTGVTLSYGVIVYASKKLLRK